MLFVTFLSPEQIQRLAKLIVWKLSSDETLRRRFDDKKQLCSDILASSPRETLFQKLRVQRYLREVIVSYKDEGK